MGGYIQGNSEDNEIIYLQRYPLRCFNLSFGLQQCIFGHLAGLRFRESIVCLTGIDCHIRMAGEQRHQCVVHGNTGDIYDGDNHIFSVCVAH
jgi:hypothetical protein